MVTQLTLPVWRHDEATFANFYPGKNQALLDFLPLFIQGDHDSCLYLWGHSGAGRSHLLQACCHYANAQGWSAAYIPFAQINALTPRVLENMEMFTLVCLDDLPMIIGNKIWEETVFHLYNRLQLSGGRLLIAANTLPNNLKFQLADLRSRLLSHLQFQVQELNDDEKLAALKRRAHLRGLELSDEVGYFLLHRVPRDTSVLFALLEKLDRMSLSEQRRLTIPFVKQVLGSNQI